MIPELVCPECGLKWLPRTLTGKPVRCPRCGKPYKGAVLVGALLPREVHEFLTKVGLDNYEEMLKEVTVSFLEGWQLENCEKQDIDLDLFRESCECFKALGCPDRMIHNAKTLPLPTDIVKILKEFEES